MLHHTWQQIHQQVLLLLLCTTAPLLLEMPLFPLFWGQYLKGLVLGAWVPSDHGLRPWDDYRLQTASSQQQSRICNRNTLAYIYTGSRPYNLAITILISFVIPGILSFWCPRRKRKRGQRASNRTWAGKPALIYRNNPIFAHHPYFLKGVAILIQSH